MAGTGVTESSPGRRSSRLRRAALAAVVVLTVLTGGYIGLVAVRRHAPVSLPGHPGRYPVGRRLVEWTDAARRDPLAPDHEARHLAVWLWYPAAVGGAPASYTPGLWSAVGHGVLETDPREVRVRSVADATPASGRFPLLVLEPGLGQSAMSYTSLTEDLAGRGYVVAGVTPTYSANVTVLSGRVVGSTRAGKPENMTPERGSALLAVWVADDRFAVDRLAALDTDPDWPLAGRVDTGQVGYLGHSFGGAAALQACHDDPHCRGAADLDGEQFGRVVRDGVRTPALIIGSEGSCVTGGCVATSGDDRQTRDAAREFRAASTGPLHVYDIRGTEHFNFADFAAMYLAPPLRQAMPLGSINGAQGLRLAEEYVDAFFDSVLSGASSAGTATPTVLACPPPHPEVRCVA